VNEQQNAHHERGVASTQQRGADESKGEGNEADQETDSLSSNERDDVENKRPPRAAVLHEVIRVQGEEELSRGAAALGWSALAGGLSMGLSMLVRALLHAHLESGPARYLVENFGYCVGFLVVILARQQLFTENTMTAVLPLMSGLSLSKLAAMLRLWGIVMIGNLVGVGIFAYACLRSNVLQPSIQAALAGIGQEVMEHPPQQMFTCGVAAGWLIATMVWLIPAAEQAKIWIIIMVTYIIGIAGFTHIVVGSAEVLYLVFSGAISLSDYLIRFALPTLAGNVVGGSLIFALISHAQIRSDTTP
jgi:formate/nitrite transporter FocA (FNT family)